MTTISVIVKIITTVMTLGITNSGTNITKWRSVIGMPAFFALARHGGMISVAKAVFAAADVVLRRILCCGVFCLRVCCIIATIVVLVIMVFTIAVIVIICALNIQLAKGTENGMIKIVVFYCVIFHFSSVAIKILTCISIEREDVSIDIFFTDRIIVIILNVPIRGKRNTRLLPMFPPLRCCRSFLQKAKIASVSAVA